MAISSSFFTIRTSRTLTMASVLGALVVGLTSGVGYAQQPAAESSKAVEANPELNARATLESEIRIRRMHDRLQVTASEEALWTPLAQVMRDNATALQSARLSLVSKKTSTAIDDLNEFQVMADHHAAGLKKFIPAFSKLYDAMPAAQQKHADNVFGRRSRSDRM